LVSRNHHLFYPLPFKAVLDKGTNTPIKIKAWILGRISGPPLPPWEYFDLNREQNPYFIKVEEIIIIKSHMLTKVTEEPF